MKSEPPSRVHRTLLPRVVLIATLITAALLPNLLWPVAAALRDAVAAAIQAHGALIATALLVIALLLAIGLIRILFAVGRKLDAQADVAAILRLENEHPIHVADLRQRQLQLIERSLAWHYQVEQVRAERSQYPNLATLHQVVRMEGAAAHPAEAPPSLPEPFRASAQRPLLSYLRERGHVGRSGTSLLVGYDASAQPLYIELPECGFIGVGGQPRVGKTTLVRLLLAQAALLGWHIALGDPHVYMALSSATTGTRGCWAGISARRSGARSPTAWFAGLTRRTLSFRCRTRCSLGRLRALRKARRCIGAARRRR